MLRLLVSSIWSPAIRYVIRDWPVRGGPCRPYTVLSAINSNMDLLRVIQQFKIPAISAEPDAPLVCGAGQFNHGAGCQQCPENTFRYCNVRM